MAVKQKPFLGNSVIKTTKYTMRYRTNITKILEVLIILL